MDRPPEPGPNRPWLLWDGACGFCCWWVTWARKRGADRHFEVLPYQEAPSPPLTPDLRRTAARAVLVLSADGTCREGGRACLLVLDRLGYRRTARLLAVAPLVFLVEAGYRLAARHRGFLGRFLHRDPGVCRGRPRTAGSSRRGGRG